VWWSVAAVSSEIKFSASHEWIAIDGTVGTVGITDYAQAS
jgi:glycine cleavage system H lipoate-binding protein